MNGVRVGDNCLQSVIVTEIEFWGIKWVGIIASIRPCALDGLWGAQNAFSNQAREIPNADPAYDARDIQSFKTSEFHW